MHKLEKELEPFIIDDVMPDQRTLIENNRWDLIVQLGAHGGVYKVAKNIGVQTDFRPKGYFHKKENVWEELKPHVVRLGRMLKKMNS